YGAVGVSPLLRVYTLNSQFQNSGWSSYASAMNTWLGNDLAGAGAGVAWRFAQYHKPMFPHYTGKSDNPTLFNWWASEFYNESMNLVVESDTHINKMTTAIKPSGSSFTSTTNGGTVFVGEGSWGAPARSANDPKSWTIDLASIQQFKVLSVSTDSVDVRTAQFDGSASTLSRTARANDPLALPTNVNWWHANGVGEALKLIKDANKRTVIDTGSSGGSGSSATLTLSVTDDTFISSSRATTNYNGSNEGLLADASDNTYGVMDSLLKWDLSGVPTCAIVTVAKVEVDVFNTSSGAYNLYLSNSSWTESSATWHSVSGTANRGSQVGSFTPGSKTVYSINLNSTGVNGVQNWIGSSNNGIVIASGGTKNGLDFESKETGFAAKLVVSYDLPQGCN
ncbi:MAG: serine protease, partial [Phenylobacterium sp.]